MSRSGHRIFEIDALNDIFCSTHETTQQLLESIGRLYAEKPCATRIRTLVIVAMEIGFRLGQRMAIDNSQLTTHNS